MGFKEYQPTSPLRMHTAIKYFEKALSVAAKGGVVFVQTCQ
jgi:hypothetical protein